MERKSVCSGRVQGSPKAKDGAETLRRTLQDLSSHPEHNVIPEEFQASGPLKGNKTQIQLNS